MKIISGLYKNISIPLISKLECRPSTGKIKEAIFSILTSGALIDSDYINKARVLDMFAGTGALGFEALSRGASSLTLVDNNFKHFTYYKEFLVKINRTEDVKLICADALSNNQLGDQYDLVFIDPPYNLSLVSKSLSHLHSKNLLKQEAVIVIETTKGEFQQLQNYLLLNNHFHQIFYRSYGKSIVVILIYDLTLKNI